MAASGAHSVGAREGTGRGSEARDRDHARTPAQWYCLLAGLGLLLAGIFGWLADSTFDTSRTVDPNAGGNGNGMLQGDSFLGFEVNGWHNLVHLLSGIVLLAAFAKRKPAKTVALAFGLVYGLVTIIGLIDGNDVVGLIPVNAADNILHLVLSLLGIAAGLISRADDDHGRASGRGTSASSGRTVESSNLVRDADRDALGTRRSDDSDVRGGRELDPEDLNPRDRGSEPTERRTL